MTIKFLADYGPYKINETVSLSAAEESALVAGKFATTNLTGGKPYAPPTTSLLGSVIRQVLTQPQGENSNINGVAGSDHNGNIYDATGAIVGPVKITGVFEYNTQLTASLSLGWSAAGYQWTRDGVNIGGATNSTYTLVAADIGKLISVKVTSLTYTGQNGGSVLYTGAPLYRFATAFNKIASGFVGVASGGARRMAGRVHRPIGSSDKKSLRVVANNFAQSGIDAITNNPTSLKVIGLLLETNGISRYVSWDSDTAPVFSSGIEDVVSDALLPSDFGLTAFSRDRAVYMRFEFEVPEGGNIPVSEGIESLSNCRSYYTNSGSVNNLAGTGAMTFSGTTSATFEPPFLIIGEDVDIVADAGCYLGVGDSLFAQGGPSSYFHQACAGSGSNYIAGCTIARGGAVANMFNANVARLGKFVKYANRVHEEYGTNMTSLSLANIQTGLLAVWANLKANKSTHPLARDLQILRSPLLNRTTTAAGDTVFSADWNAGGKVEQLHTWLAAQEGQALGFHKFMSQLMDSPNLLRRGADTPGVADSNFYKWPANLTNEGLHLNNAGASGTTGAGANARVYYLANM